MGCDRFLPYTCLHGCLRPPKYSGRWMRGGKFIYLENVIRTRNPAAALDYPGGTSTQLQQFIPLYLMIRGATQRSIPGGVGFPLASILCLPASCQFGLYVLPAVGGALGLVLRVATVAAFAA